MKFFRKMLRSVMIAIAILTSLLIILLFRNNMTGDPFANLLLMGGALGVLLVFAAALLGIYLILTATTATSVVGAWLTYTAAVIVLGLLGLKIINPQYTEAKLLIMFILMAIYFAPLPRVYGRIKGKISPITPVG
jgi:hypothetical protein